MIEVVQDERGLALVTSDQIFGSWDPMNPSSSLARVEHIGWLSEQQGLMIWASWLIGARTSLLLEPHWSWDKPRALLLSTDLEETVVPFLDPPLSPGRGCAP